VFSTQIWFYQFRRTRVRILMEQSLVRLYLTHGLTPTYQGPVSLRTRGLRPKKVVQVYQMELMFPKESYKYLLKRVKCAFSDICNSCKVHHSIKLILCKYFINLITSQVNNFSGEFTNKYASIEVKIQRQIIFCNKDTDFASPKSAYINWSLPGSGNKLWRTLTAPKFPRDRLSWKRENLFSTEWSLHLHLTLSQRSFRYYIPLWWLYKIPSEDVR
jgi:hypothetical protein